VRIGIKSRLERFTGIYHAMQSSFAKIISAIGNKSSILHMEKRKDSWRTSQKWSGTQHPL
jgi:hypothetical protein